MFENLGFIEKFNIKKETLNYFLSEVCKHYNFVPFHNMTHVFNVTHVMYWIICCGPNDSYFKTKAFTDLDKLAMLIACIGHDLNHPGLGNTYF